jgi:hypothetical protein
VAPDSILAVTFTNKAAGEMAERVEKLIGHGSLAKPLISTFHSFCVRLLRRDIEALRVNNEGLTKSEICDLRRDGSAGGGEGRDAADGARRQAADAAGGAREDFVGEEPHDRSAGVLPAVGGPDERAGGAHFRGISQGAAQGERAGLRRSAAGGGAGAEGVIGGAGAVQPALPVAADRRISGYESAAVRADEADGGRGQERLRGGRRGSEHLFVAGRGHSQHPGVREGFSGREDGAAGAELPVDADHSGSGVGGGGAQRDAEGQAAVDFARGRRADRLLRGSGWGERGAVHRGYDPEIFAEGG